jgi:hypothetical protein
LRKNTAHLDSATDTPNNTLSEAKLANFEEQGWKATSLDNARKFRMKFTVADPIGSTSLLEHVKVAGPGLPTSRTFSPSPKTLRSVETAYPCK